MGKASWIEQVKKDTQIAPRYPKYPLQWGKTSCKDCGKKGLRWERIKGNWILLTPQSGRHKCGYPESLDDFCRRHAAAVDANPDMDYPERLELLRKEQREWEHWEREHV